MRLKPSGCETKITLIEAVGLENTLFGAPPAAKNFLKCRLDFMSHVIANSWADFRLSAPTQPEVQTGLSACDPL